MNAIIVIIVHSIIIVNASAVAIHGCYYDTFMSIRIAVDDGGRSEL